MVHRTRGPASIIAIFFMPYVLWRAIVDASILSQGCVASVVSSSGR